MNILNLFRKATKQPNAIGTPITMEILKGIVTWQGQNANSFVFDGYAGNDIVYSIITLINSVPAVKALLHSHDAKVKHLVNDLYKASAIIYQSNMAQGMYHQVSHPKTVAMR